MPKSKKNKTDDLFDFIVTPKKVIFVDWSVFVHRSIFAWRMQQGTIPSTYYCLNSIFTCLKLLKPKREDLIILALDSYGKGNWRRDYDTAYKANRKEKRQQYEDIDWKQQFSDMNKLLENVNLSTPFIPIQIDRLEADDIISYGCRYYKDRECTILTTDSDMNQLYTFGNVRIFSPVNKKIRTVINPLGELTKKIQKEATDNLLSPITTKDEYEKRKTIVSLLTLPPEIEEPLEKVFSVLTQKDTYYPDRIMFSSLQEKFKTLYID